MPYDETDLAAFAREHPRIIAPVAVRGPRLTFRVAQPSDAEFILSLRLDPGKNQYLSATPDDVEKQRAFLKSLPAGQCYFIIEAERLIGTVRLYDQRGTSFSWGSWILTNDAPKSSAVESMLMVYRVGLDLGFTAAHFDVRKANTKVWQFHERCGAERTSEDEQDIHYSINKGAILRLLARYESRGQVAIDW